MNQQEPDRLSGRADTENGDVIMDSNEYEGSLRQAARDGTGSFRTPGLELSSPLLSRQSGQVRPERLEPPAAPFPISPAWDPYRTVQDPSQGFVPAMQPTEPADTVHPAVAADPDRRSNGPSSLENGSVAAALEEIRRRSIQLDPENAESAMYDAAAPGAGAGQYAPPSAAAQYAPPAAAAQYTPPAAVQFAPPPAAQYAPPPAEAQDPVPSAADEAPAGPSTPAPQLFRREPFRPDYGTFIPQRENPSAAKPPSTVWWVPLVLVMALLLGICGGIIGGSINGRSGARSGTEPTAAPTPSWSQELPVSEKNQSIGEKIIHGTPGEQADPAAVYEANIDAVVGISNEGTTRNIWGQVTPTASSGTGFVLSADGYILTNYHVVKGADTLTVSFNDGRKLEAQVVGYEATTCDVALLKVDAEDLQPVKIGDSDLLRVGDRVCTIGNPLGELSYSLTVGYISAKERAINTDGTPIGMIQTDTAINSGNSGGPLFDASGSVVGIVTAKYSGSTMSGTSVEGIGFAIPINAVMNLIEDLRLYGRAMNRAYLGVHAGDTPVSEDESLPNGAYITEVEDGYCAKQAGLQAGDVVIGINNRRILSFSDLFTALQNHKAGQTAELKVYRAGETLTFTVTFDARPED